MGPLVSRVTSGTQSLDAYLVPRTYLVGNYLTAADVAVYGALQPIFVCTTRDCDLSHASLTHEASVPGTTTAQTVSLIPVSLALL